MSAVFGEAYASFYDLIYADKAYDSECDAICEVIRRFGDGNIRTLLDIGCGTGRHAAILSGRGYKVTGLDRSAHMLTYASRRALDTGCKAEFIHGDIRYHSVIREFDLALFNFNVLGYMREEADLEATFAAARRNSRFGALLVADFWYGPAVLANPPSAKVRRILTEDGCIERFTRATFLEGNGAEISFRIVHTRGQEATREFEETHPVRYFFPGELEQALHDQGFRTLAFTGFPRIDVSPDADQWTAAVIAKAI